MRKVSLVGLSLGALVAMLLSSLPATNRASARDPGTRLGEATLLASEAGLVSNHPVRIAIRLVMPPGWHTYWHYPGDAGAPTTITWTLPPGFVAAPVDWPIPSRFVNGPVVSYGYQGEAWLMTTITPPSGLTAGSQVDLVADIEWLACADICVPEMTTVRLQLPVLAAPSAETGTMASDFRAAEARLPRSPTWPVRVEGTSEGGFSLSVGVGPRTEAIQRAWFFPGRFGLIDNAGVQTSRPIPNGLQLVLPPASPPLTRPAVLEGVLVLEEKNGQSTGYVIRTDIRS
jgi:thiol:disulfide interchange protein DsbD